MFDSAQLYLGDPTQLLVILGVLVVIMIWGPSKIPELARAVGRARKEFDDASRGIAEPTSTTAHPISSDPLVDTAQKLGISTQGKTREQISDEIVKNARSKNQPTWLVNELACTHLLRVMLNQFANEIIRASVAYEDISAATWSNED